MSNNKKVIMLCDYLFVKSIFYLLINEGIAKSKCNNFDYFYKYN